MTDSSKQQTAPFQVSATTAKAIVQATTADIFNERDQSKRRALMEKYWSPHITAYDPTGGASYGFDEVDKVWDGLHSEGREKFDFSVVGPIRVLQDLIHVGWEFGDGGRAGEGGMKGLDVILVGGDGKVERLYGMFEDASIIQ